MVGGCCYSRSIPKAGVQTDPSSRLDCSVKPARGCRALAFSGHSSLESIEEYRNG
jgi:hypothetical protein